MGGFYAGHEGNEGQDKVKVDVSRSQDLRMK